MAAGLACITGCHGLPSPAAGQNDVIIAAGRRFHTGTRVVLWNETGGYDGYQGGPLAPRPVLAKRAAGQDSRGELAALQENVDQLVLHYDGCGLSRLCFEKLRERGLSVHFLLDLDGTVYQALDLRERALHATIANDRSIGIELANVGAFPPGEPGELAAWYRRDGPAPTVITVPEKAGAPRFLDRGFVGRPIRPGPVRGAIQGQDLIQYDFTVEQYRALARLTAALGQVFPLIRTDYPRDALGRLITQKLPDKEWENFHGILGHFHIQANKVDPGPALQWDKLINEVQRLAK